MSPGETFTPLQGQPRTPRDWAQYFIERCGYRIDQVVMPKTMAMFRQWLADGVTLEDADDGALSAEAKKGGLPNNPLYYDGFVREVRLEKARAKENPAATRHSAPGSITKKHRGNYEANWRPRQRISSAEQVRRDGIEYLRRVGNLTDAEWAAYLRDIGEFKPDPLTRARAVYERIVDSDGRDISSQVVI